MSCASDSEEEVQVQDVLEPPTSRQSSKAMYDRLVFVEHHLGKFCHAMSAFTVKTAQLRDKSDEISKVMNKFSKEEKHKLTSKYAMNILSELFGSVGDHRNAEVLRIEAKILPTLSSYGGLCKNLKADVKHAITSEARHLARFKDVERLKDKINNPKFQSSIALADGELEKASAEANRQTDLSENNFVKFELKRISDLKDTLKTFCEIQIAMHAKALEIYTQAYEHVESIDEYLDVQTLRKAMHLNRSKSPLTARKKRHHSVKVSRSQEVLQPNLKTTKEIGRRLDKMMNLGAPTHTKATHDHSRIKHHGDSKKANISETTSDLSSEIPPILPYPAGRSKQKKSIHTNSISMESRGYRETFRPLVADKNLGKNQVSSQKHAATKFTMKNSFSR